VFVSTCTILNTHVEHSLSVILTIETASRDLMWPMAINDPGCLSPCLSGGWLYYVNAAEQIEVLLLMEILGDPGNILSDGSPCTDLMRPLPNYFGHLL